MKRKTLSKDSTLLYTVYGTGYKIVNIVYRNTFGRRDKAGCLLYDDKNFPLKGDELSYYSIINNKLRGKIKGYEHEYFSNL